MAPGLHNASLKTLIRLTDTATAPGQAQSEAGSPSVRGEGADAQSTAKRVADTSLEAFRALVPFLSKREAEVVDGLRDFGRTQPTAYELFQWLRGRGAAFDLNSVRPRLTALSDRGVVTRGPKRTCAITGKTAYTWALYAPSEK